MNLQLDTITEQFSEFLKILNTPIFQFNSANISIGSIFVSALIIFTAYRAASYLGRLISFTLANRGVESGARDSIEKFTRYILIIIGCLMAMENIGISIKSLAALGAVLMVGIGFGLQNIAQNFISGIIILIERPIKVGDIIRVGSTSGRVIAIHVRSSIIQTRDDVTIIVPNSKIVSEEVINESFSGQQIRQRIRVGVAYGSNLDIVKNLICQAASGHQKVLAQPAPQAVFCDFGESSLDFDVRFWCAEIWDMDNTASDIRMEIERLFREHRIVIPFPQRDLHYPDGLPQKNIPMV